MTINNPQWKNHSYYTLWKNANDWYEPPKKKNLNNQAPFFHCLCVHRVFLGGPHSHWWEPTWVPWRFSGFLGSPGLNGRPQWPQPKVSWEGWNQHQWRDVSCASLEELPMPYLLPQESKQHPSSEIISQQIALLWIFQFFKCFNAPFLFFSGNPHCLHYHPIPKKIQLNSLGRLKKTPPQCHPPKKWPAFVRIMNHHCPLIIPLVKALFPGGIRTLGFPWMPMISRIFVAMKLSSHVNLEPRPGDGEPFAALRWVGHFSSRKAMVHRDESCIADYA